jgi:hypothetical protein
VQTSEEVAFAEQKKSYLDGGLGSCKALKKQEHQHMVAE